MKLANIKEIVRQTVTGVLGWHTNRKIVVFESDDWGSIRTSNNQALNNLEHAGFKVKDSPFSKFDALESNSDILGLIETLNKVKDKNGEPAKFTLNNIVANPDFEKIHKDNYLNYHYEMFTQTYKKYPEHHQAFQLLQEGLDNNLLQVQLHGREHVNVNQWMKALQSNNKNSHLLFQNKMFSAHFEGLTGCRNEYLQSLGIFEEGDLLEHHKMIKEGASIFHKIWGFRSDSFIAPCYTWNKALEETLAQEGVIYLQGTHVQKDAKIPNGKNYFNKRFNYLGKKNKHNQRYIIRNCWFEPSQNPNIDSVSKALKQISQAFRFKKPAVICSHRLNYIGFLSPKNRSKNLESLTTLLLNIKKQWPDVEFLSTDQLGKQLD